MNSRRIAIVAIFSALALIVALFEYLLPPIVPVLPYAKVGISHIVILSSIVLLGNSNALIVFMVRTVLLAIFVGNPSMLMYSMPAGLASMAIMILLIRLDRFSLPAISMASAAIHNMIQIIIASFVTGTVAVFIYLPYLMVFGAIAGLITGIVCYLIIKKLPVSIYINNKQ